MTPLLELAIPCNQGNPNKKEAEVFEFSRAITSFSVDDVGTAAQFYQEQLGIEVERFEEDRVDGGVLLLHPAGGNDTLIYPKPDHVPATYTILNFVVADIDDAVTSLAEEGVRFLRYDDYGTDEMGILRAPDREIAWFTDPAGNIHSVVEFTTPSPLLRQA